MEVNRLFNAYLDDFNKITILLPKHYFNGKSQSFTLIHHHEEIELIIEHIIDLGDYQKYICLLPTFVELGVLYFVRDEYGNQTDLQSGAIVRNQRFDTLYYYEKNDLGITYSKDETTFKIWAPTATNVSLILKNKTIMVYPMNRKQKGIYEVTIFGDLEGYLYRYKVTINHREKEIIDVYGIASNANYEYSAIINKDKLIPVKSLDRKFDKTEPIIYELSIRDFTIDKNSGVKHRGKYLGLVERQTQTDTFKSTGLDYLIELGISHIQLLPFFDFSGVDELDIEKSYNWGYNPEQYNTPEGSYSTNPSDIYSRINELRTLINGLHENKIGIIMDVVYNHVSDMNRFPFEFMVPGYFYRYDHFGMPSNGSGCGNDLATEREMVRKFIIDSVKYWAKEYKIDGFRFDLMGIMDIETINRIRKELNDINPSILMYGEGWNLDTPLTHLKKSIKENAFQLPSVGFFNDQYRDIIKGQTFNNHDVGYAFGNFTHAHELKQLLSGSVGYEKNQTYMFFEPYQTINFLECHDNLTMYDKIKVALEHVDKKVRLKRQRLATSMLLLSQGIPFLHAGQEFYRTKYGVEDSYNSPDKINMISWKRREEYDEDVCFIRELIKVRKSHGAFYLNSAAKIKKHVSFPESKEGIIIYDLNDVGQYGPYHHLRVIFNCTEEDMVYKLESDYKLIFDEKAYFDRKNITNYIIARALNVLIIGK